MHNSPGDRGLKQGVFVPGFWPGDSWFFFLRRQHRFKKGKKSSPMNTQFRTDNKQVDRSFSQGVRDLTSKLKKAYNLGSSHFQRECSSHGAVTWKGRNILPSSVAKGGNQGNNSRWQHWGGGRTRKNSSHSCHLMHHCKPCYVSDPTSIFERNWIQHCGFL